MQDVLAQVQVACEQAFSLSSLFFPKQRACSQAKVQVLRPTRDKLAWEDASYVTVRVACARLSDSKVGTSRAKIRRARFGKAFVFFAFLFHLFTERLFTTILELGTAYSSPKTNYGNHRLFAELLL